MKAGGWTAGLAGMRRVMRSAVLTVVALLYAVPPVRLSAQDNPAVRAAVQLAAEGLGDSARALVASILTHSRPGDSTWVEALYWRARLAATGDSAERDLRRVAIEYSGSKYADHALLQLSQLALAAGNPVSALDLATRLRSDYPGSVLRPRAALWAARAAFDVGESRRACLYLDTAKTEAASDVEFGNQVRFYEARCTAAVLAAPPTTDSSAALARPDSAAAPAPAAAAPTPSVPVAAASRGFEVQVAAARSSREAQGVVRRLTRAHRTAHVVAGADGLYRVRVGPFSSLQAADSAVKALRRIVGGSPFAVRAP
ncbi:MAG: SPOR domain-containing protein [Gemmatimonadales bacterium]